MPLETKTERNSVSKGEEGHVPTSSSAKPLPVLRTLTSCTSTNDTTPSNCTIRKLSRHMPAIASYAHLHHPAYASPVLLQHACSPCHLYLPCLSHGSSKSKSGSGLGLPVCKIMPRKPARRAAVCMPCSGLGCLPSQNPACPANIHVKPRTCECRCPCDSRGIDKGRL
ncbi:hypothetical protein B0H12DRAFT_1243445 [Mycena haematopus]|nr:hypothetical protein B0H12DRAFT_1243445 [Mycena haematopus]